MPFHFQSNKQFYKMYKGRNQGCSTLWEGPNKSPIYLDSAYKQLLRQDIQAHALKNRTKALNLNQEHMVRQIQNSEQKLYKLESIRQSHSNDARKLDQDQERKDEILEERKQQNSKKKQLHSRQMSNLSLQKDEHLGLVKKKAMRLRREHSQMIEAEKRAELQKKKEARNRIHNDIKESRATIQNFFKNKHDTIVMETKEQVKSINEQRAKKEARAKNEENIQVQMMERQLGELKKVAYQRNSSLHGKTQSDKFSTGEKPEEGHPLLRRIQNIMNRYTKLS